MVMAPVRHSTRRSPPIPEGFSYLELPLLSFGFEPEMPDVIEFVLSDAYLDKPNLYPRQATLLKIMFLRIDLFTDYDYAVIEEWVEAFHKTVNDEGDASNGISPDIIDRIWINRRCPCEHDWGYHGYYRGEQQDHCSEAGCDCTRYRGRKWFREVIAAMGRRGSKGFIGGLGGSHVLYHYLSKGDPQGYYGIDRNKKLAAFVFGGKKEQARVNQWQDLVDVILDAPCFSRYVSKPLGQSLSVYAPHDVVRMYQRWERGISTEGDMASFLIEPKESTPLAGRGPASFMQFYDEMAHVVRAVAKADAGEVYDAATPSLDQFKQDAWLYEPSSTWQKTGQFYINYQQALETESGEHGAKQPVYPEKMMIQLASWDIYKDWERASDLRVAPRGLFFSRMVGAVQEYDKNMELLERANPEGFRVERRSHWATAMNAYLREEKVDELFSSDLSMQTTGLLSRTYRAHGDPSKSGANFGFAVAHIDHYDERGLPHVVYDYIHAWLPQDYENGEIDYELIGDDIIVLMDRFMPVELSFDQWNSVSTIQRLRKHARSAQYPKRVEVDERTATGPLNWKTYETFKTALYAGLLSAPYHELASQELKFLQDLGGKVEHPTSGPIQTKDVADCMAIVCYELIGDEIALLVNQSLSDASLRAAAQGGITPPGPGQPAASEEHQALSNFGAARRQAAARTHSRRYR